MANLPAIGSVALKILKLVLNLIILILYRSGFAGNFLGVGGTWNLNEEKNPDSEIVASGVFVGFFIYTLVSVVSFCFASADYKHTFTDIVMNFLGIFLWIAVGATALHYWNQYLHEDRHEKTYPEQDVGLAMGSLCIITGGIYIADTGLSTLSFVRNKLN